MGPMREKNGNKCFSATLYNKNAIHVIEKVFVTAFEVLQCRKINSYTLTQFT